MKIHDYYVLDEKGEPVPCGDLIKWGLWYKEKDKRKVAWTRISEEVYVSTVFLGVNHNFIGNGKPVLWETTIFGHPDRYQEYYTSRQDAMAGHERAVKLARGAKD